jgi:hypothetical protein
MLVWSYLTELSGGELTSWIPKLRDSSLIAKVNLLNGKLYSWCMRHNLVERLLLSCVMTVMVPLWWNVTMYCYYCMVVVHSALCRSLCALRSTYLYETSMHKLKILVLIFYNHSTMLIRLSSLGTLQRKKIGGKMSYSYWNYAGRIRCTVCNFAVYKK